MFHGLFQNCARPQYLVVPRVVLRWSLSSKNAKPPQATNSWRLLAFSRFRRVFSLALILAYLKFQYKPQTTPYNPKEGVVMSSLFPNPPAQAQPLPSFLDEAGEISKITDTVSHLLDLARVPSCHRGFIDSLLGAANGALDYFDCSDLNLSSRMRPNHDQLISDDGRKKFIQRCRAEFIEWQAQAKILLVEWQPGGQDKYGEKYCTRYRLPLLRVAAEVLASAKGSASWSMNDGGKYLERFIREKGMYAIHDLRKGIAKQERFNRPRESAEKYIKSSITYARKAAALSIDSKLTLLELAESIRALALAEDAINDNEGGVQICTPHKKVDSCPYSEEEEEYGQDTRGGLAALVRAAESVPNTTSDMPPRVSGLDAPGGGVQICTPLNDDFAAENQVSSVPLPSGGGVQICTPPPNAANKKVDCVPSPDAAFGAMSAFELIWADSSFKVGFKDEVQGALHSVQTLDGEKFRALLPSMILKAAAAGESFIVRPEACNLIQLDDLSSAALERIEPFAFLALETSPDNFQAWVSVSVENEARTALRRRLIAGLGADSGASGAMRWPGSLNCKPSRRLLDGSFPAVRLFWFSNHAGITPEQLDSAGLLAPEKIAPANPPRESTSSLPAADAPTRFPDYGRELAAASGDRSRADLRWCLLSLAWGWSRDQVGTELPRVSEKARARRAGGYVRQTVEAAARWLSNGGNTDGGNTDSALVH
jgi:hypothetical protein